jgi:hypothetical protein
MRVCAAIAVCVVLSPRAGWAYRPFDSTDAAVAAPGQVELELGPLGYVANPGRRFLAAPSVILNLGLFSNWELVLQGRHFVLVDGPAGEPRFRLVETGLFLKGVVRRGSLQGGWGPSAATEIGPLLPTLNGDAGVGATAVAIVSQRWTAATIHANGAVSYTRAHNLDLFGGVIVEGPYARNLRPVAEVFVQRELDVATVYSGLVGAIWRVTEGLSLDAAGRAARVSSQRVLEARIGLSWTTWLWESR